MNILIYPNFDKENGLLCTRRVVDMLLQLGAVPLLEADHRDLVGEGPAYGRFSELLNLCDVIMPVGGDGTIMRVARHAASSGRPLIGVNAGRLGFLTQLELHELEHLELLVKGSYSIQTRMMLEAELDQGGKRRRYTGLNDVIISRGDGDRIVDIDVHQGDMLVARNRADGLIFATPTGATAYSLSAGGPIVDPGMSMVLLTTICAHSTFNRSMVLPSGCEYTITDHSANNIKGLAVSVDGRRVGKLPQGGKLLVRRSSATVGFVDLGLRSFYESVNRKLSWGK